MPYVTLAAASNTATDTMLRRSLRASRIPSRDASNSFQQNPGSSARLRLIPSHRNLLCGAVLTAASSSVSSPSTRNQRPVFSSPGQDSHLMVKVRAVCRSDPVQRHSSLASAALRDVGPSPGWDVGCKADFVALHNHANVLGSSNKPYYFMPLRVMLPRCFTYTTPTVDSLPPCVHALLFRFCPKPRERTDDLAVTIVLRDKIPKPNPYVQNARAE